MLRLWVAYICVPTGSIPGYHRGKDAAAAAAADSAAAGATVAVPDFVATIDAAADAAYAPQCRLCGQRATNREG
jgi:hypothetical protein